MSDWEKVAGWPDVAMGSRVKVVAGEETFVGVLFGSESEWVGPGVKLEHRRITSETAGDIHLLAGSGFTDVDELHVDRSHAPDPQTFSAPDEARSP